MKFITVVGSINYDLVTSAERVPGPGETAFATSFETHHGGKGANQALACRRLSDPSQVSIRMVGKVGDDTFGVELKKNLDDEGIDVSSVEVMPGVQSGTATIIVEPSGENRILVNPGANWKFSMEDVSKSAFNHDTDMIILQNEIPMNIVIESINVAYELGIPVVYNPSPVNKSFPTELFSKIKYLIVNTVEAEALSGQVLSELDLSESEDNWTKSLHVVMNKLNASTVIVTLGSKGCIFLSSDGSKGFVPASKAHNIVDTTGAGDTFLGAFASRVVCGSLLSEALLFASRAAALAVTKKGASESIPRLNQVED